MEIILLVGGIWFFFWLISKISSTRSSSSSSQTRTQAPPRQDYSSARKDVYRPRSTPSRRSSVVFTDTSRASGSSAPSVKALEGLHDAFTGASLNPVLGLHQCTNCKVYYHLESVAVLREENASRCVACGSTTIVALTAREATTSKGRDYSPDIVTLATFRRHFDRVVTFEGLVQSVKVSRRGKDYAVMFEQASWTKGLKLVFFRGGVRKAGGSTFITSLSGRTVRVRGLLIDHPRFGPEIVITERGMILGVK